MQHFITPWGNASFMYDIVPGVTGVETSSHGGYVIDTDVFALDPRLMTAMFTSPEGRFVFAEEDVDWAALLYCHPELLQRSIEAGYVAEGITFADVLRNVERWHPDLIPSEDEDDYRDGTAMYGNHQPI